MDALKPITKYSPVIILILFSQVCLAQTKSNNDKSELNDSTYHGIYEYHPVIAGAASYILPGLGQIYCNENQRGVNFFKGYVGGLLVMMTGAIIDLPNLLRDEHQFSLGKGLMIGGGVIAGGTLIWSTVDAVKLANFKNKAFRNHKVGMSLLLKPDVGINRNQSLELTLAVKF